MNERIKHLIGSAIAGVLVTAIFMAIEALISGWHARGLL